MNVFSAQDIAVGNAMIQDLVDSFGTPVTLYIVSQELFISQDGNFNFAYGEAQPGVVQTYAPQTGTGTYTARIKYLDNEELKLILATQNRYDEGQDQLRLLQSKPVVRLKLDSVAAAFLGDVDNIKRITFDNYTWVLILAPRWHGLFNSRNYLTIYLQRTT